MHGLLVSTPRGFFAALPGGRSKPSAQRATREFFSEVSGRGPVVERGSKALDEVGEVAASARGPWDVERLDGDVSAVKYGACAGAKTSANAVSITKRDGSSTEGWLPDVKVDFSVALWASKADKLLGLLGNDRSCALVAPLERKHAEQLPCPGYMVTAEAHGRASITSANALRVVVGHLGGLGFGEISLDGKVVEEELPPHIQGSISGRRGLFVLTDRSLIETNDDGRSWVKVPAPPFGPSGQKLASGQPRGWLSTCTEAGCRFYDGTRRIGWELQ